MTPYDTPCLALWKRAPGRLPRAARGLRSMGAERGRLRAAEAAAGLPWGGGWLHAFNPDHSDQLYTLCAHSHRSQPTLGHRMSHPTPARTHYTLGHAMTYPRHLHPLLSTLCTRSLAMPSHLIRTWHTAVPFSRSPFTSPRLSKCPFLPLALWAPAPLLNFLSFFL